MTRPVILHLLGWIWSIFGIYWVLVGFRAKQSQTSESPLYRVFRWSVLAITFALLFARWTAIGPLGVWFRPENLLLCDIGFVLAICGMVLALWARIHLGQYWSDKVVLKVDHQLIRSGPYARLRHPIYSGVLLGVAGTAFVVGEWRGVLAFVILFANYWIKARREDQILANAFGAGFAEHRQNAGFLLPNLRSRA